MAKAKTKKTKKVVETTVEPVVDAVPQQIPTTPKASLLPHRVTQELLDLKNRVSALELQLEKLLGAK